MASPNQTDDPTTDQAEGDLWAACERYIEQYREMTGESLVIDVPDEPAEAVHYLITEVYNAKRNAITAQRRDIEDERAEILASIDRLETIGHALRAELSDGRARVRDIRPQVKRELDRLEARAAKLLEREKELLDRKEAHRDLRGSLLEAETEYKEATGTLEVMDLATGEVRNLATGEVRTLGGEDP